ncbi:unnamed protein product [Strongylus vulgaris]|uniref:SCP domain-containing protein n=1 Tax=Strongylus vulgaris TaxID=40348 RepID=A0A3P7L9M8_STRVU|nr:unnamed protein product [Strongylus vulgaris]
MCPNNEGMTDTGRTKIVNAHNYRRGLLARGLIRNGKNPHNRNLPKAYNMPRVKYNCSVEASAIGYASLCAMVKSMETARPGYGENIYIYNHTSGNPVDIFDAVSPDDLNYQ